MESKARGHLKLRDLAEAKSELLLGLLPVLKTLYFQVRWDLQASKWCLGEDGAV